MSSKRNTVRVKPVPQRTCVACRQVRPKRELVRLVRLESGTVEIDTTGRMNGRGAYLCHNPGCWQTALKKGNIERALRTVLSAAERQRLAEWGARMRQGVSK